jgi:hypothetical protein
MFYRSSSNPHCFLTTLQDFHGGLKHVQRNSNLSLIESMKFREEGMKMEQLTYPFRAWDLRNLNLILHVDFGGCLTRVGWCCCCCQGVRKEREGKALSKTKEEWVNEWLIDLVTYVLSIIQWNLLFRPPLMFLDPPKIAKYPHFMTQDTLVSRIWNQNNFVL